jgi:hypothetical protein
MTMPDGAEIRVGQKRRLFELLKIRKEQGDSKSLNNVILAVIAEMEAEDVAWVEKQAEKLEV